MGGINHPDEMGTGIQPLSILKTALKLHFVPKFEPVDKSRSSGIQKSGKRGRFTKVSIGLNETIPVEVSLIQTGTRLQI